MNREEAREASRLWLEEAALAPEAQTLREKGWQIVSRYGYTHGTGWSIARVSAHNPARGTSVTLLWDGKQLHGRLKSPLKAAEYHTDYIRAATRHDELSP
ncbi:hypothetical protein WT25_16840 [Burkholderia territorii]|uniref:hypothetical protein n=1 Tax=Burkholderia territorii TaxID=1503055 RepID=UPI0007596D8D|nr:hypothetical protein [Burkholderia territorii]KVT80419.1 hypothetical protein WT25_16840 [Burkholderia territorii]